MSATATVAAPARRGTEHQSRRGLALAVILTVQLMVVLDATIVNIALPHIATALHFTPANLSWVITAYTLAFGGFLLLGARAGDLLGRRRVFVAGIAVFTLASFLGGVAPTSEWLLVARALQGIGGALAAPSALALLMTMFRDGEERVRAIGWYTAVSVGGGAIGLIVGGLLTQWASWRWVLFVNVPIGIVVIVLARRALTETPSRNGHFDVRGALTSTIGVTSLAYGFVRAATSGWGDAITVLAFAAGIVFLALFIELERRAPEPITPLRLFADRSRSATYVARLFLTAGMFGMFFFLTQFLQEVLHYGPLETGLGFLPFTVALFSMSQLSARRLVAQFGGKTIMVVGLTISTAGMVLMTSAVGIERLRFAARTAAAVRCRQRARVRAADLGVAQWGPSGRGWRGVGTGQRDAAARRRSRPRRVGIGLRHRSTWGRGAIRPCGTAGVRRWR